MMEHGVDIDTVVETGGVEAVQKPPLVVDKVLIVLDVCSLGNGPEQKRKARTQCLDPSEETKAVHDFIHAVVKPVAACQQAFIVPLLKYDIIEGIAGHDGSQPTVEWQSSQALVVVM